MPRPPSAIEAERLADRHPTPPEHLAKLNALLPELRPLLLGEGLSREWLSERTGVDRNHCTRWLHAIGAKRAAKGWRLPNLKRLRDSLNFKTTTK